MKVVVSGAAGQIAYSFLPKLCSGDVFGPDNRLDLRLLDIPPALETLQGVQMELDDCSFNLIDRITTTSDPTIAFEGADVAVLIGGFPRKQGMLRKDLIARNVTIFREQGQAIEAHASRDIKVVVVANPANTNCFITMSNAPSIPKKNFTCLTRLDHERLRSFLVRKLNETLPVSVNSNDVRKCMIWGNHSATQYPDCRSAQVNVSGEWKSVESLVNDRDWTRSTLVSNVQQRGAAVIAARKLSSAMSAASAVAAHLHDWYFGSSDFVSMGILSTGNPYGVPDGLIYSFPLRCSGNWSYEIVDGINHEAENQKLLVATSAELSQECTDATDILSKQTSNL